MHERPATLVDVPGQVGLWRRFEQVSGPPETHEAAARNDWDAPGFPLERSTLVLVDGDRLLGDAVVDDEGGTDPVVDPAGRPRARNNACWRSWSIRATSGGSVSSSGAPAPLHEAFRRRAARSVTATLVGVGTTDPTGALRLYERAGMQVVEQLTRWEREARTKT